MRINLIFKDSEKLESYLNIDPRPSSEGVVKCELDNLDPIVDDSEVSELRALDAIDFFPPHKILSVITHWKKKIKKGGKLTVGGVDLLSIARALHQRQITITDAISDLYNSPDNTQDVKMCCSTLEDMVNIFQHLGLTVEDKTLRDNRYVLIGVK